MNHKPQLDVTKLPLFAPTEGLSAWLSALLATACGLIAANIYYAQPLIGPISASLGLSPAAAGLIVTVTQIGYGAALLLIAPLADLVENRSLVSTMLCVCIVALIVAATAAHALAFLWAAMMLGVGSVAVQILVPYAAHLAPAPERGRAVGNVMSGLMLGIMLSRPAASFIASATSWHAVFTVSAIVMTAVLVVLRLALPRRKPATALTYKHLLISMAQLARTTPILQRRALYHTCLFGAFSLFWTTVPLLLVDRFHLSQRGIALFALAGVAGAISAPIAGRAADRGWSEGAMGMAMVTVAASLLLSQMASLGSHASLVLLVFAAILLDFGTTANFVLGQRAIFGLGADVRGRLNGLYMAAFFAGGAASSALGGWTYAHGGWSVSMWAGLGMSSVALLSFLIEKHAPKAA